MEFITVVQCHRSGGQVLLEEYSGGEGERGGEEEGLGGQERER